MFTARQGDVLIRQVRKRTPTGTDVRERGRVILAHGEVTGHHHALESADPADWWKEGEIPATNEKPTKLAGELFVTLPAGGVVTHQEHSEIKLPPGNYRITRQREYSPEANRDVED